MSIYPKPTLSFINKSKTKEQPLQPHVSTCLSSPQETSDPHLLFPLPRPHPLLNPRKSRPVPTTRIGSPCRPLPSSHLLADGTCCDQRCHSPVLPHLQLSASGMELLASPACSSSSVLAEGLRTMNDPQPPSFQTSSGATLHAFLSLMQYPHIPINPPSPSDCGSNLLDDSQTLKCS